MSRLHRITLAENYTVQVMSHIRTRGHRAGNLSVFGAQSRRTDQVAMAVIVFSERKQGGT